MNVSGKREYATPELTVLSLTVEERLSSIPTTMAEDDPTPLTDDSYYWTPWG